MKHNKINNILILVAVITLIIYLLTINKLNVLEVLAFFSMLILFRVINKTFNLNLNNNIETMYLVFIIMAQLLGHNFSFYKNIFLYDKLVHFYSGVLTSLSAILILRSKYKYSLSIFNILFVISFTSLIAVLWEGFEYISSLITGVDLQNVLTTGIKDTLGDIFIAVFASIIVLLLYRFNKKLVDLIIN